MKNILDSIFANKKKELADVRRNQPLSELKNRVNSQKPPLDVFNQGIFPNRAAVPML